MSIFNRNKTTEALLSKEVDRLTKQNERLISENTVLKSRIVEIDKIKKEYEVIMADAKKYKDKAKKTSIEIEKLKDLYKEELVRLVGHKIDLDIDEEVTVDDIENK